MWNMWDSMNAGTDGLLNEENYSLSMVYSPAQVPSTINKRAKTS